MDRRGHRALDGDRTGEHQSPEADGRMMKPVERSFSTGFLCSGAPNKKSPDAMSDRAVFALTCGEICGEIFDAFKNPKSSHTDKNISGGRRGIRTLDTEFPYAAFPGRYNQPLCHPSVDVSARRGVPGEDSPWGPVCRVKTEEANYSRVLKKSHYLSEQIFRRASERRFSSAQNTRPARRKTHRR